MHSLDEIFMTKNRLFLISLSVCCAIISFAMLSSTSTNVPLIPLELLFGNPEKRNPQISPDGKKLAFCAPVDDVLNIWVKTLDANDAEPVTKEKVRGIYHYYWAPNSKQILYSQDTEGDENYHLYGINLDDASIRDYTPFPHVKAYIIAKNKNFPNEILIALNKRNSKLFDAYHLDLVTGLLTVVAENPGDITDWFADNQLQVRAAVATHGDGSETLLARKTVNNDWKPLLTVDFEDTLIDEIQNGILIFSHDNDHLYLHSSVGSDTKRLISLSLETGSSKIIAQDTDYDIANTLFDAETHVPILSSWEKECLKWKVLSPELEDDFSRMCAVSTGNLTRLQKSDDQNIWVLGFMRDNASYEYYVYDRIAKQSKFLFYTHSQLNTYQLASMEPIVCESRDGLKIHGYLTYPVNSAKKNLPLVVFVHGGPFTRDSWGYDPIVQLLANRGCACLQVNFRGSSGYGKKFLAAGNQQWGAQMHDDLIDAVQWAIEQKIADPKKIAIFGGSYGGYAALVGATFTPDVFACAIDFCGPSNLITLLKNIPPYWSLSQWEKRIGSLQNEDFLLSRSPLYKIDQIRIPLLIAHGAHDVRVTQAESEQIVDALKKKNIAYDYLLFSDEGHGLLRPANRFKFFGAIEKFLAKHLGTRSQD